MEVIKTILGRLGSGSVGAMAPNERHTIVSPERRYLRIEKVGPARLRVDHRDADRIGRLQEPTAVFRTCGQSWVTVGFRRRPSIHRYDTLGVDVSGRLSHWNDRLRDGSFIEAVGDRTTG